LKLDMTDIQILEILGKDARLPFTVVGKTLGISDATVHIRVKRMTDEGVITGYSVDVDEEMLDSAYAFIMLDVKSGSLMEVIDKLLKNSNVVEVYEVHGPSDLIVKVSAENIRQIRDVTTEIREGTDITSAQVVTLFKTWRKPREPLSPILVE